MAAVSMIISAIGNAAVGQIFPMRVCNTTAYIENFSAGTGVTLTPASPIVQPGQCANYALAITNVAPPAVTIVGN